jgi:hypothetical protein
MKKVSSIIALVAMTLSLSSFNSAETTQQNITEVDPRDCVREARTLTSMESDALNLESPNDNWGEPGSGGMLDVYMAHYRNCMGV